MIIARLWRIKTLIAAVMVIFTVAVSAAEKVKIVILASADIHGKVETLRLSAIPALQKEFAAAGNNAVYVDVGDTAQGTFDVDRSRGIAAIKALNQANCTVWVPGNHELEFGFNAFKELVKTFSGDVLAANLHAPELRKLVKPYKIVTVNKVKVAFIGLMIKDMNNCFPVSEKRFQTLPGRAALRKSINSARKEGAEVIVLLRHAGIYGAGENLADLLRDMPEIDLVIGAHTHTADAGTLVNRIWYVQPPAHGEALIKAVLYFDPAARKVAQIESELIALNSVKEKLSKHAMKKCIPADNDNNFVAKRIRRALKADLAIYAVGSMRSMRELMLLKEPRLIDYYRVFNHFDPIITVKVTPAEVRTIVREYARLTRERKQYLAVDGFTYDAPHGKLRWINFAENKKSYILAISAYAAAGAGGMLPETRRILKNRIDLQAAEKAHGVLSYIAVEAVE